MARCGPGDGPAFPSCRAVRASPLEPLFPRLGGAGGHRLRHLAQLAGRQAEPVVLQLAWVHAGGPGNIVAACPDHAVLRGLDPSDGGAAAFQHRPVLPAGRLCAILDVDRLQCGVEDRPAGLVAGVADGPAVPVPHLVGAVPELVGRAVERPRREDSADRHGARVHIPRIGGHDGGFPEGGATAAEDRHADH